MTDFGSDDDEQGHGREGALAAMLEVVGHGELVRNFEAAAGSLDREDYEAVINLAWRYQFDDDRSKFKRGINQLQAHLSPKIEARLDLSE